MFAAKNTVIGCCFAWALMQTLGQAWRGSKMYTAQLWTVKIQLWELLLLWHHCNSELVLQLVGKQHLWASIVSQIICRASQFPCVSHQRLQSRNLICEKVSKNCLTNESQNCCGRLKPISNLSQFSFLYSWRLDQSFFTGRGTLLKIEDVWGYMHEYSGLKPGR